jgi:hypothetical protein
VAVACRRCTRVERTASRRGTLQDATCCSMPRLQQQQKQQQQQLWGLQCAADSASPDQLPWHSNRISVLVLGNAGLVQPHSALCGAPGHVSYVPWCACRKGEALRPGHLAGCCTCVLGVVGELCLLEGVGSLLTQSCAVRCAQHCCWLASAGVLGDPAQTRGCCQAPCHGVWSAARAATREICSAQSCVRTQLHAICSRRW